MKYIANAFSLGMLPREKSMINVKMEKISLSRAKYILANGFMSAVGHEATAEILTRLLGMSVEARRIPIQLNEGDTLLVFQLQTRLEEGQVLSFEDLAKLDYSLYKITIRGDLA